jgi:hypothetical protein
MSQFDKRRQSILDELIDLVENRWGYPDDASSRSDILRRAKAAAPSAIEPTLTYHGSGEDLATDVHHLLNEKERKRFATKWLEREGTALSHEAPAEPKLDKQAQVGATVFGIGVKWSTVIDRAQREWDYFHGLLNPRSSEAHQRMQVAPASSERAPYHPATQQALDLHQMIESLPWWGDVEIVKISTKTVSELKAASAKLANALLIRSHVEPITTPGISLGEAQTAASAILEHERAANSPPSNQPPAISYTESGAMYPTASAQVTTDAAASSIGLTMSDRERAEKLIGALTVELMQEHWQEARELVNGLKVVIDKDGEPTVPFFVEPLSAIETREGWDAVERIRLAWADFCEGLNLHPGSTAEAQALQLDQAIQHAMTTIGSRASPDGGAA